MTKKTSTPMNPPRTNPKPAWNRMTGTTAQNLSPSISLRYFTQDPEDEARGLASVLAPPSIDLVPETLVRTLRHSTEPARGLSSAKRPEPEMVRALVPVHSLEVRHRVSRTSPRAPLGAPARRFRPGLGKSPRPRRRRGPRGPRLPVHSVRPGVLHARGPPPLETRPSEA